MKAADFYFDFVSPFSHLCLYRLREVAGVSFAYRPVLFAGLLNHWGQKGPAEIPAKRLWTYRWCAWWAGELGIPFRFPAEHPFNSLPHLRLAIACDGRADAVKRIFDWVWTNGESASDPKRFGALCAELGVDPEELGREEVKGRLRRNTEEAATRGVFGVPSLVLDGEVFWGADSLEFFKAFLANPALFSGPEMRRVAALPVGAARKA